MIINIGLGAKPGNKPASLARIATNLLHATQWAAMHEASIRMFNEYSEDPTVVIDLPAGRFAVDEQLEVLRSRCNQQCIAVYGLRGQRLVGQWDEQFRPDKFIMPDGRTLHAWLTQPVRSLNIPRRDYGEAVDPPGRIY